MSVDLSAIGNEAVSEALRWDARDCAFHALACGATFGDDACLFPGADGGLVVSPALPLVLISTAASRLADPLLGAGDFAGRMQVLASQSLELHRPMPARGAAIVRTRLSAIEDAGNAARVVLTGTGLCAESGEPLFTAETVMSVAGEGGFGGPHPPAQPARERIAPWRKTKVVVPLSPAHSLLYGVVANDRHGIHVDPTVARAAGLRGPILTGHNLLGIVAQAIAARAPGGGLPVRAIRCRFARPAYNGERLLLEVWQDGARSDGVVGFRVSNDAGEEIVSSGECVTTVSFPPPRPKEDAVRFRGFVLRQGDGAISGAVETIDEADLPEGDVDVDVAFSSLNYKDGMILNGLGRLVREYPHVPGIDFAGTVRSSRDPRFRPGDAVVLTGWRVGEIHWGGLAERARVKGDWLVHLPAGLSLRASMAIGTAGLTAMLCVDALEHAGVRPGGRPVLVTGGSGGVGGVAITLLAAAGYEVYASTGRPEQADYLRRLGAFGIVPRADLAQAGRPLDAERWAGAVDSVGSQTLATVLSQVAYGGAVAACGLAGGSDLPATVMPFLLRGVSLLGIDSVMCPIERREAAWARIAATMPRDLLDEITSIRSLADLPALGGDILAGRTRGRTVIDLGL